MGNLREKNTALRTVRMGLIIICLIPLALLGSCSRTTGPGGSAEGTGGVSMKLVFPVDRLAAEDPPAVFPPPLAGVQMVTFTAINSGGTVASASFAYTLHSGTLSGIPVGSQYRIEVEARSANGLVKYRCAKSAVRVNQGRSTDLGSLHMLRARPFFTESSQALGNTFYTSSIALGDVDGDGELDLVEGNAAGRPNRVWIYDDVITPGEPFHDSGQRLGNGNTASIALGDVDGDERLDIVEGNNGPNLVWRNNGAGAFSDTGQRLGNAWTTAIALGDVNDDGALDLVEGNYNSPNCIWLNDGSGSFADTVPIPGDPIPGTNEVALGDLDGDGDLDLVYGRSYISAQPIHVMVNSNGQGNFTDTGQALGDGKTSALALGDVDGDDDLDLMEGCWNAPDRVWLNDGTGVFTDSGQTLGNYATSSIDLVDLDGDGDLDLAEGNDGADRVYLNNGAGMFGETGQLLGSYDTRSIAVGDLDGDGAADIVEGGINQPHRVWKNGPGSFESTGQDLGESSLDSIAVGDVDGDGDLDAAFAGGYIRVLRNDGAGAIGGTDQSLGPTTGSTDTIALADLDGDGDLDLVEGHADSLYLRNRVWINDGTGLFSDSGHSVGDSWSDTLSIALGDLDGDGDEDMVEGRSVMQPTRVWINNGAAVFASSGQALWHTDGAATNSVALGDVDGDGDLDIVEGNIGYGMAPPIRIWVNDGDGLFSDSGQAPCGTVFWDTRSVVLGDVDRDGDLDIVQANYDQPLHLYLNDRTGGFTDSGQEIGGVDPQIEAMVLGDLEGDGDLDMLVGGQSGSIRVFRNDGTGVFAETGKTVGSNYVHSLALGDLNGDGTLDLLDGGGGGLNNRVWLNR